MSELEFQISGETYRAGRLSAFDQFEVAARMAPALLQLGRMRADGKTPDGRPLGPVEYARALCLMSGNLAREQMDAILAMALARVHKRQGPVDRYTWAPVAAGNGQPMFPEFGELMACMIALWHVLEVSRIPDFFFDPPSGKAAHPKAA